jgi:hypothetical protein
LNLFNRDISIKIKHTYEYSLGVHILVDTANVLVEVLANRGEFAARHADHAECIDLI